MLRVLRRGDQMVEPPSPARVIGIDNFAWRRGHSYGSIIVDLERRQVIDLLPDRQRETVVAWLRQNPQVEIIRRDRGPGYIAAAKEAAPKPGKWPIAGTCSRTRPRLFWPQSVPRCPACAARLHLWSRLIPRL